MTSIRTIACLMAIPAALAQTPVVLSGPDVRVEVQTLNGRFEERYLARSKAGWQVVARAAGESVGAVSWKGPGGEVVRGTAGSAALEGGRLVERMSAGGARLTRTIALDPRGQWLHVSVRLEPGAAAPAPSLHSFADAFRFAHKPDWSYSPSVGGFNPDAQYKAPLILSQGSGVAFGVVPDLAVLDRGILKRCHHALRLDVPSGPRFTVGFQPARTLFHAVYTPDEDRVWTADATVTNAYYLLLTATAAPGQAYREAVRFHWERFGRPAQASAAAQQVGTDPAYTSLALFDDWRRQVWDKESVEQWLSAPLEDGVGGAVRTVRWGRPKPSLYMSAWFNSVRTAVGMALYARRTHNRPLLDRAAQTIHLALHAPGRDGAFKCIAVPDGDGIVWAAGDGIGNSLRHGFLGFDMSWTAYWLLRWRAAGLPGSDAILPRAERLADFFLRHQQADGMLPTRFDESGAPQPAASRQVFAETAPVALFLLELAAQTRNPKYRQAGLRGLEFLERQVIPERKWYDFETFFSCSPRLPHLDTATAQWPANNLALIHAPAAYLAAFRLTGRTELLDRGLALLDYLLLYQQAWTNPALEKLSGPNMLLGGFTTQNSDAEWSDARQSLAANVILDYYRATGLTEYLERGVAALRSQFPISPSENWAHAGYGGKAGVSSFHWGTGSGMAGVELEEEYLHDVAVDVAAGRAVGVNGIDVKGMALSGGRIELRLASPFPWPRPPVAAFLRVPPGRRFALRVNGRDAGSFPSAGLERGVVLRVAGSSTHNPF